MLHPRLCSRHHDPPGLERRNIRCRLEAEPLIPRQPIIDPLRQDRDLLLGERIARRRHAHLGIGMRQALDDLALGRFARHRDLRLEQLRTRVEGEAVLVGAVGVALRASRLEHGHHIVREVGLLGRLRRGWRDNDRESQKNGRESHGGMCVGEGLHPYCRPRALRLPSQLDRNRIVALADPGS